MGDIEHVDEKKEQLLAQKCQELMDLTQIDDLPPYKVDEDLNGTKNGIRELMKGSRMRTHAALKILLNALPEKGVSGMIPVTVTDEGNHEAAQYFEDRDRQMELARRLGLSEKGINETRQRIQNCYKEADILAEQILQE